MGTGLPLIGGGGTVKYLTNMSRGQAIPRKSDENFKGQAIPYEYLTNTGSCLFWAEFRPSRKFSNTFDVEIPHSAPGDEKKQSDPLALIFIHILTYLEEELAWRHWERLLRATSTWAIFTVLLYKKDQIKTSPRCVPPMTQGPHILTRDSYHTNK